MLNNQMVIISFSMFFHMFPIQSCHFGISTILRAAQNHESTRRSGANTTKAPRVKIIDFGMVPWRICWDMLGRDAAMSMRTQIYIYRWLYTHNLDDIRIISAYIHAPWIHGINRIHIHTHIYIYMCIYIYIYLHDCHNMQRTWWRYTPICKWFRGSRWAYVPNGHYPWSRPGLVKMVRAHFLEKTSKLG